MPSWDVAYGPDGDPEKSRFLRLHAAPSASAHGTVVVLHGGYWKNKFGLDDVPWQGYIHGAQYPPN